MTTCSVEAVASAVRTLIVEEMLQGHEPADLTDTTHLVSGGIVDSINVIKLVDFLEETYRVELEPADIREMTTIERIVRVVQARMGA